jgi:hypothetical protein
MSNLPALPPIDPSAKINSGAFGTLYRDPRNPAHCIKVLKDPMLGEEARSLIRLAEIARWARPSDVEQLVTRFAWPIEIFGDDDAVHGYTMPLAPNSCYFELTVAKRTKRETLQIKFLTDDSYWRSAAVTGPKPNVSYQDRLEIAIDCLDSMEVLHRHGLAYGDISGNNIVARMDARPGVFFFDADSITTVDLRNASPLVSPGWETPEGLDPLAIDRSRFAILVFRLLVEQPNAKPDWETIELLPPNDKNVFGEALVRCYFTGLENEFMNLAKLMRDVREDARDQRALQAALDNGFARWVLREKAEAKTAQDRRIVTWAEAQLAFEIEVDDAVGLEYRKLLRRNKLMRNEFVLDVRPRIELSKTPSTSEELHQLIYDALFVEITSHFSSAGLGKLETDPWLERAIQHAHYEVGSEPVSYVTRLGEADIKFSWPVLPFVNCAKLTIESSGHRQELTLRRSEAGEAPLRLVKAPNGANCRVVLSLGSESPSGLRIYCPPKDPVNFSIPAIPTPVVPNRSQGGSLGQGAPHGQGAPVFDFVDPVEEERKRLEAIRIKKTKRIKVFAAAVVSTIVLAFGGNFAYHRYFVESDRPTFWELMVQRQVPKLLLQVDETGSLQVLVNGTIVDGDQIAIYSSPNGSRWRGIEVVDLEVVNSLEVSLGAPADRYVRVRYVRNGRITASDALIGAFDDGFAVRPVVVLGDNEVFAQWTSSVNGNRGPVTMFNYRTGSWSVGFEGWARYFTLKERTQPFAISDAQASRGFQVQAVFSNGSVGPWVTAVPQS